MIDHILSAIVLAGGIGSRMQVSTPKQYLLLNEKPIARHSFDILMSMPEIAEVVVVCEPQFQSHFVQKADISKKVSFALPGQRRQDSVYHGLQKISLPCDFVCIHDSCRPFIDRQLVLRAFEAALQFGAATVGMPLKFTVKTIDQENIVINTPDRSSIWEIQTPQIINYQLLQEGFQFAIQNNITVTDDVSLVELLGKKVKLVEGSYKNLKITVPTDLQIATHLING